MAVDLHPDVVRAINQMSQTKLGRRYDRFARRQHGVRGEILMARSTAGEGGGLSTKQARRAGQRSSAGAFGPAQFIPSTRAAYIQQYGVDPWKSDRAAFKGMMLHHLSTGVAGYNPGMPSYTDYIMGQRINKADLLALRDGPGAARGGRTAGAGGATRVRLGRPGSTEVGFPTYDIPGQSMEPERQAARRQLLLGGDINLKSLLRYKAQVAGLRDIPGRKVTGDLQVTRTPGTPTGYKDVPGRAPGGGRPGKPQVGGPAVTPERIARGKWGGSKLAGKALVKAAGLPVSSRKRGTVHTASGGVSDHYEGNTDSYAWDMSVSGPKGTAVARKLARMLGVNWSGGSWLNVNKKIGGEMFRFQLGWNVEGHYDHIHMGVDRVSTPG